MAEKQKREGTPAHGPAAKKLKVRYIADQARFDTDLSCREPVVRLHLSNSRVHCVESMGHKDKLLDASNAALLYMGVWVTSTCLTDY